MLVSKVPGLSPPQMLSVGDVNTGGWPISNGSPLYPSPLVNGVSTINGPAIQGAFTNNTRQGFVIGNAVITPGAIGTSTYFNLPNTAIWASMISLCGIWAGGNSVTFMT